ncbi:hypothetical protein H6P81_000738 [Aristolochia fimbriata]|uniref:Uncharacterized protein n=1 Tax=Aristolochia fimbriata TaxID=158543 RepID=A0AAV7F4Y6_ARIFI|nr:hypothetical protein H6P81_000738 [Aristolochia fimbriata]
MVEKKEEDELSLVLGAAEALMQISAGGSYGALLPAPPQAWGQHRPRSRQITLAGILRVKMEEAETGSSPKSTLLWTCATSPSDDGVDVCEARPTKRKAEEEPAAKEMPSTLPSTVPSTIPSTMPSTSTSTSLCRRVKKKKTLDELREEETALVSANVGLKGEIEKMQRFLADLRRTNESLKLKLHTREEEKRKKVEKAEKAEKAEKVIEPAREKGFLLPDLNEPFEHEMFCVAEQQQVVCGMS